jgi:hypothetical protein
MSAYIDFKFHKGFLLNEENLRKITDIISKRLPNLESYTIKYSVYRNDSFCFDTHNISDILNEGNSREQKINTLMIMAYEKNNTDEKIELDLRVIFDSAESVRFKIIGENRDFVFLLGSDIKEYIGNNIAVCLRYSDEKARNFGRAMPFFLTMALFIIGMNKFISVVNVANREKLSEVDLIIKSNDISEKLNYILKGNTALLKLDYSFVIPLLIGFFILLFAALYINKILSIFIITNVFIIGKEKEIYDRRVKRRANIIWVGLIGLILSIISGILVWKITG